MGINTCDNTTNLKIVHIMLGSFCALVISEFSSAVQGHWDAHDSTPHINVLARRVIHVALKHFFPHLQGKYVLVRPDNKAVVSHINHQVGTKSVRLLHMSEHLLAWAAPLLWILQTVCLLRQVAEVEASPRGCGHNLANFRQGGGGPVCVEGINPFNFFFRCERAHS